MNWKSLLLAVLILNACVCESQCDLKTAVFTELPNPVIKKVSVSELINKPDSLFPKINWENSFTQTLDINGFQYPLDLNYESTSLNYGQPQTELTITKTGSVKLYDSLVNHKDLDSLFVEHFFSLPFGEVTDSNNVVELKWEEGTASDQLEKSIEQIASAYLIGLVNFSAKRVSHYLAKSM